MQVWLENNSTDAPSIPSSSKENEKRVENNAEEEVGPKKGHYKHRPGLRLVVIGNRKESREKHSGSK
jgi:hypothetical protein